MSNFIDTNKTFQTRGELIDYVRLVCRDSGYGCPASAGLDIKAFISHATARGTIANV